jgi:hypothetical protein
MLSRIFPKTIDNNFRGKKLAIWLLVPITLMKLAISLLHIFWHDGGAQSISTIALDSYPTGAAQNIIALFARMGLDQFVFGLICVVVLIRYRAMIPLMYVMLVFHYAAEKGIAVMKPLALVGTSGASTPALVLALMAFAGLILSLTANRPRQAE